MIPRHSSQEWLKRTELAKVLKEVLDYKLKVEKRIELAKVLKKVLDHKLKVVVHEQCQQVKGASSMVSDFHDHIP